MEVHVVSPKYIRILDSTVILIKTTILKALVCTILLVLIKIVYLQCALKHYNSQYGEV